MHHVAAGAKTYQRVTVRGGCLFVSRPLRPEMITQRLYYLSHGVANHLSVYR